MRLRVWILATLACIALPVAAQERLRLATTTSTENTGLLGFLIPTFEKQFAVKVEVLAVGSGQALKLAENGDADVVLSHAPPLEDAFIANGFGVNRRNLMYNDFIIVGPPNDPAGIKGMKSAAEAMKTLATKEAVFLSRGDESGTHVKEKELWAAAGVTPSGGWYRSAGVGMGQLLQMADESRGYTLTDRGTYLSRKQKGDLVILVENDPELFNPYSMIATNPARHPTVKYIAAMQFIAWMTSPEGQKQIASFTVDGKSLFIPTAVPVAP